MKRISQNKFASSLFSCLGVAACVAFSSCGKKDNDQFKNANEFAEFLKSKAKERGVSIDDDQLTKFANDNWKTANKKTFQFTEAIKKQIAGEDLDNENEELNPDQEQPNPDPEQQNPGTEQPKPEQPKPEQPKTEQPKPGTEQPKTSTADPSGTTTITNESKLSELISGKTGEHAGVKISDHCFDLNVFYDLYSWIYNKVDKQDGLVSPADLTWGKVKTIVSKSEFPSKIKENEKKFGINAGVSNKWTEENTIYTYEFTASSTQEGWKNLECPCYNGLLKFWMHDNNLGFNENSFTDGKLNDKAELNKTNEVATKLVEYLKNN